MYALNLFLARQVCVENAHFFCVRSVDNRKNLLYNSKKEKGVDFVATF